jgi:Cdc6-like AAA superfamily ATPase
MKSWLNRDTRSTPEIEPDQDASRAEEYHLELPYLLDWPELGARYHSATLTLAEALSGGANLLLIGKPGTGKTVALASAHARLPAEKRLMENLPNHSQSWSISLT